MNTPLVKNAAFWSESCKNYIFKLNIIVHVNSSNIIDSSKYCNVVLCVTMKHKSVSLS